MSNFNANKNPPWARQDLNSQSSGLLQSTNVTYPYNAAQTQFAQNQMPTSMQPQTNILSSGHSIQSTQPSSAIQMGAVTYPVKTHATAPITPAPTGKAKTKIFTGSVTKMHDNFGFVDEEVFFQVSCVKGAVPKVGDKVLVEASYNASMPFKWNATRVITLNENQVSSQMSAMQQQQQQMGQQQQQQLKAIQQQAMGLLSVGGGLLGAQNLLNAAAASSPQPLMGPKFQSGGTLYNNSRSGVNNGPGLLGDPGPRAVPIPGAKVNNVTTVNVNEKPVIEIRDRRDRDRPERLALRAPMSLKRRRSRSPIRRSPSRRSRSPKRREKRPPPRYVVQVPKIQLDIKDTNVISLKSKYNNLYVPSDFFHASYSWVENFPLTRPFTLGQTCSFHVMHKDIDCPSSTPSVDQPSDADHLFSAKVMLLASPTEDDLIRKSSCLAEDLPEAMDNFQHPTRLLQFLVGTRGKNEPMAIGGPWSPSLDGPNPQANPLVLIKTAIRTTKTLTGIDLSSCTQWYRFAEIRYFRPESKYKDRVQPARVETVVLFLPDVWTCNPTRLEWDSLNETYQTQLQLKLNPPTPEAAAPQQEEEEEPAEETPDAEPKPPPAQPTHFSNLDPKTMKVTDLRQELELRSINSKGLKSQLMARLTKALATEQEKEKEAKDKEVEHFKQNYNVIVEPSAKSKEDEKPKAEEIKESEKPKEEVKPEEKEKTKEEEEKEKKEKAEAAKWERRFKLPEHPSILVHPSKTAKSGKFECTTMSLSVLLDYRQEDNKEHSFEVSLFAELFNEMLMRDFGFTIYKAIANSPKLKEDKKRDDKKDDRKDKDEKKEEKKSDEASSPKKPKTEKEEDSMDVEKEDEKKEKEKDDDKKDEDKKKKEKEYASQTINPELLLACSYFDQNHCGYITDRDVEELIHTLGLKLSRAQVKKIISKVLIRDNFKYRKLTDIEIDDDGKPVNPEPEPPASRQEPEQLAKGNNESLRKLLQLSGAKVDESSETSKKDENPSYITYKGSVLDVESLMARLDKSEKSRNTLEKNLIDLNKELSSSHASLEEQTNIAVNLKSNLESTRYELDCQRKINASAEATSNDWTKAAKLAKMQMEHALKNISTIFADEEKEKKKKVEQENRDAKEVKSEVDKDTSDVSMDLEETEKKN